MQINKFDGGLNIREDPLLVQPNEALVCNNVNTSSNTIKSSKDATKTSIKITSRPYYFRSNESWEDMDVTGYLEYQGLLYYTDGENSYKYDGENTYNLGIVAPTTEIVAEATSPIIPSDLEADDIEYEFSFTATEHDGGTALPLSTYSFTVVFYKPDENGNDVVVRIITDSVTLTVYGEIDLNISWSSDATNVSAEVYYGSNPYYDYGFDNGYIHFTNKSATRKGTATVPDVDEDVFTYGATFIFAATTVDENGYESDPSDSVVTVAATETYTFIELLLEISGSYSTFKFYLKYGDTYYLIKEGNGSGLSAPSNYDGILHYVKNIDIDDAEEFDSGGISGTVQYVYTYYNEDDDTESAPSPVSEEIEVSNGILNLSEIELSTDPQVTHIKIYRVGGNLTSFTEIDEVDNTETTYTDSIADEDVDGDTLTSTLNDPPPEGLTYLKQAYGLFVGAVGSKFYFTRDIGNPNYWPATYYINFHEDITGIGVISAGILVCTKYSSYLISGTSASTFVKYTVSGDQGCLNYYTMVEKGDSLLFVSTDGICLFSGSKIEVLSKYKLGKIALDTVNAVVHDEVYYLQLSDLSILAFDFRYSPSIKYYSFDTEYLVIANDILYGLQEQYLYQLFSGDNVQYEYKTGKYAEGVPTLLKTYKSIFVAYTGIHTIYLYVNDVLVNTYQLSGSEFIKELKLAQKNTQGYYIQFHIFGTGDIKEIRYETTLTKAING